MQNIVCFFHMRRSKPNNNHKQKHMTSNHLKTSRRLTPCNRKHIYHYSDDISIDTCLFPSSCKAYSSAKTRLQPFSLHSSLIGKLQPLNPPSHCGIIGSSATARIMPLLKHSGLTHFGAHSLRISNFRQTQNLKCIQLD